MCWLASATIHQDSVEIGLFNAFRNFMFLWPFVIIDRQQVQSKILSQQEITPNASCS